MSYDDGFETIEIPEEELSEVQKIIVEGFIREGQFKARESIIEILEADLKFYRDKLTCEIDQHWIDGVGYALQIVREANLNGTEGRG